ncbi:nuclease-related domain-containing protein [Kitasatospora griseola]|uniref:nuclease-related domain-containing protein n=1 Tax=Kitasatospora griseola TaxID=2064 RepID=UPI003442AF26
MTRRLAIRPVSDNEYVQRIRRHAPSSLLPLIARTSARVAQVSDRENRRNRRAGLYGPWGMLDAAWMSIVRGTEFRDKPATPADLDDILQLYFALEDPMFRQLAGDRLTGFLLRTAGQQFVWQVPDLTELARPVAIFQQTKPNQPEKIKAITSGWDQRLLGCSLSDYIGAATLLCGFARASGEGRLDLQQASGPLLGFTELTTPEAMAAVIDANFVTTASALRARAEEERRKAVVSGVARIDPALRRHTFNPLRERPVLSGFGPGYLVPVPAAVVAKVSPYGIYYSGFAEFGQAFADDLGDLFEQYVGRHLRLVADVQVYPEVVYRANDKSVDWIVVFDDLVLLVEVKSARPTAALRLGPADWFKEIQGKLKKAFSQLQRTADLISSGHKAFAHIPADRPVLGMVVTMEEYHLVNSLEFRSVLPSTSFPVTVAAANELEEAVTQPDLADLLRAGSVLPAGWSLRHGLEGRTIPLNPILARAWEELPLTKAAALLRR